VDIFVLVLLRGILIWVGGWLREDSCGWAAERLMSSLFRMGLLKVGCSFQRKSLWGSSLLFCCFGLVWPSASDPPPHNNLP
jgi:hypothetical protein